MAQKIDWVEPLSIEELNATLTATKLLLLCHAIESSLVAAIKEYSDKQLYKTHYSKLSRLIMPWIRNDKPFTQKDRTQYKALCTIICKQPATAPTLLSHYMKEAKKRFLGVRPAYRLWHFCGNLSTKPISFISKFTDYNSGPFNGTFFAGIFFSQNPEAIDLVDIADQLCHAREDNKQP